MDSDKASKSIGSDGLQSDKEVITSEGYPTQVQGNHSDIADALAAIVIGDDSDTQQTESSNRQQSEVDQQPQENEEPRDPLWWSPLEPEDLDVLRSGAEAAKSTDLLFTNEELAEALKDIRDEDLADTWENSSFETDKDQPIDSQEPSFLGTAGDETFGQPIRESLLLADPNLPELNFADRLADGEADSDDFLLPSTALGEIFDAADLEPEPIGSPIVSPVQREPDQETLEVLRQLEALSLDFPRAAELDEEEFLQSAYDPSLSIQIQQEQELICQPCNPDQEERGVGPDSDLFTLDLQAQEYATDIDNMLSQLSEPDKKELLAEEEKLMSDNELLQGSRLVMSSSVMAAVQPFLQAFRVKPTVPMGPVPEIDRNHVNQAVPRENRSERRCLGHRERILSVRFSPCGNYLATASADSTIRVWRPSSNQLLATLPHHNSNYECLRVAWGSAKWLNCDAADDEAPLLATAGADGNVYVLKRTQGGGSVELWDIMACIDHSKGMRHYTPSDADDRPQIYSLQFVEHWEVIPGATSNNRFLLTSSEDHVHVWEVVQEPRTLRDIKLATVEEEGDGDEEASQEDEEEKHPWHFKEVFSLGFGNLYAMDYGICVGRVTEDANPMLQYTNTAALSGDNSTAAFGGDRNPNGVIFVFDASYCPTNGLLGVALSDGSLRLLNGRGECLSVLQLPGANSHLTSFCWDSTGTKLATSVASTGHVITWEILLNASKSDVQKTACQAILGGGHEGTVFGTYFCASKTDDQDDPLLLSWGVDGRVSVWHAQTVGEADFPIATLVNDSDYPIFGLDYHERTRCLALVGGSGDGGFIGIPALLYDIEKSDSKPINPRHPGEADGSEPPKKARMTGKTPEESRQSTSSVNQGSLFATALEDFLADIEEENEEGREDKKMESMKKSFAALKAIIEAGEQRPMSAPDSNEDSDPPVLRVMKCLVRVSVGDADDRSGVIELLRQAARLVQGVSGGSGDLERGKARILHDAARRNQVDVLRFAILELKWNVNSVNQQGMTALQFAARSGKSQAVSVLLDECGADLFHKDSLGQTALDAARKNKKEGIVQVLIVAQAKAG